MITRITYTEFLLRFTINKNQYTFASQTITMAYRLDIVCNENGCDTKFLKIESLRNHLISVHGLYHEPEEIIEFDSESELQDWISELNNQSVFFISKGPRDRGEKSVQYLQCNRSGKSVKLPTPRNRKQNVRKLDKHCTCTLKITRKKNGPIYANYFATHYNHEIDKAHKVRMPISKTDKEEVEKRLKMGVAIQKIRTDFCSEGRKLPANEVRTIHFKKRQGFHNIKNTLIINDGRLHKSDEESVKLWKVHNPNFFIYLKFLGDKCAQYKVSIFSIYYINTCN